MSELGGKVFLVTGANTGIGRVTAEVLAQRGALVLLACRSREKAEPVLRQISERGGQAEYVELDLSDLKSVRTCAAEVLGRAGPLHVLINNAGLAGLRKLTRQGFELTFGVNHLGHFLLTQMLLPKLLEQPHSRVVIVSSKAHYSARGIDFEALRQPAQGFTAISAYNVSKLANVLHAKELARRYGSQGLHSYALHPGVVASDVWRQVPQPLRWLLKRGMISNEAGAQTTLYCAASPEVAEQSGLYYDECREKEPSEPARSSELGSALWNKSLEWTAEPS
jgi:retinol dehydrogenase-12